MPAIREEDLENNYQSEILFLLIGENPLPNYVAAKLLTKRFSNEKNPVLYLIHSENTKDYAKNLDEVLNPDRENKQFSYERSSQAHICIIPPFPLIAAGFV